MKTRIAVLSSCAAVVAASLALGQSVSNVSPEIAGPGSVVVISGSGFGEARGKVTLATEGDKQVKTRVLDWSEDSITVRVPNKKLAPESLQVVIHPAGIPDVIYTEGSLMIGRPQIEVVRADASCTGWMAIDGSGFGGAPRVKFGGTPVRAAVVVSIGSRERIIALIPAGSTSASVELSVRTKLGTAKASESIPFEASRVGKPKMRVNGDGDTFKVGKDGAQVTAEIAIDEQTLTLVAVGSSATMSLTIPNFSACSAGSTFLLEAGSAGTFSALRNSLASPPPPWLMLGGDGSRPGWIEVKIREIRGRQISAVLSGMVTKTTIDAFNGVQQTEVAIDGYFVADIDQVRF